MFFFNNAKFVILVKKKKVNSLKQALQSGASFHFSGFDLSLVEKDPKNQTKTKGKKNREWFSENCAKEKLVKRLQRFKPKT